MQNENKNTSVIFPASDASQAPAPFNDDQGFVQDTQALSLDPIRPANQQAEIVQKKANLWLRVVKRADVALALFLVMGSLGLVFSLVNEESPAVNRVTERFETTQLPLSELALPGGLNLGSRNVIVNGSLQANNGLIIVPSLQPSSPEAGQLYYDQNTNLLAYFNGSEFISLAGTKAVEQIGGLTGQVLLGPGLGSAGGQLANTGVLSVQGQTGSVTLVGGNGIVVDGTTIINDGIVSVASSSPTITVTDDGNGNITLGSTGVASPGGTAGRIAKFIGAQEIGDSLLSESGTTITVTGDLQVTSALSLGAPLGVASGGTGAASLAANGVLIGNGSGAVSSVAAGGSGLCLISTTGAPAWGACSGGGGGVTSLNGLSGGLTIANATGSVNTITIDDAGTSSKGIASFNGVNFSVASGAVNTIQNISPSSTPTFAGLNTNTITPSGSLNIGASTQSFGLLGNASSAIVIGSVGQATTLGFTGAPTGNVNYNFDRSVTPGTYQICTTAGNCDSGGTVSSPGGTANRLSKFTGAQTIADSSISDDGSTVTINGTANLVVQGGTSTLGTLTQAGNLLISDGSSNTVSIVTAALAANRVYTLPDAGGDAVLCVNSGNCIGGGGSAPNGADYLVTSLNGTLTNDRALSAGSNISFTDGGANANFTVATVQNPTFATSVTTPVLQSSGALTISSAAGNVVAVDAGTTIELQDSTNVTGSLDVSVALNVGTGNAFQVNASGAVTAATGITSSGTIIFSGLNCTTFANGGALTTNASGQLACTDDDGGAGGSISGSGTAGTLPVFTGSQVIGNSIVTQAGTTVTIAGDLVLNDALTVANGGTGATSFTSRGVLYGNGTGTIQVTAAPTAGQVLVANGTGTPAFASFSGDVSVSSAGLTAIQPNSVALGTDTTGDYVANLGALTGLSTTGNSGEGSTPTLSVAYGSLANTAVQGNVTVTCPSGTGNLTGGGTSITLGNGGTCGGISIVNNPTFTTSVTTPSLVLTGAGSSGTIQVGNLGQGTVYTLPDPGAASTTICIATGNCSATGTAGGDLTGSYPNPTIAKLQGTNLAITGPTAGNILVYNATNAQWENRAVSGDIAISETGAATIQANSVALGTDTTGNYVLGLTAGNGVSVTGSAAEGWSPTVAVLYGSSANTAVEGNTGITVSPGTNLAGGGSITLGAGGTVTLNVVNSPTFSGTLAVQGATATVGTAAQQGSVVLNDGSSNTVSLAPGAFAGNRIYTLPDVGGDATLCLSTGNCAGSGGGVTGSGTNNRVSKFTSNGSTIGDSSISDDGSTVTINGTANLVVQGGTSTLGTTTQAGTLAVSDGSSNTVSIVAAGLGDNRVYTLPDAGGDATFCMSTGNCVGGGGGSAPNDATYLLASLNGTLTNDRALNAGSNISFTDGGANGNFTVATVPNPTFTTSVTTPVLQSSGALTISSAAGNTVAIDAGTTIELQDSTNITGSLDISVALNAGTANAFQVSSAGAIAAATGITSAGTIIFSGLNCTTFANGGALTTNASGQLSCTDDDSGSGGITGSGTAGTIPVFTAGQVIGNSIITQSGTTIDIAGDLTLDTALTVANGGTGATTFTARGLLYGNGTSAIQVTAAPTAGQVLVANGSGVPAFVSFSGDVAVSNTGVTSIQPNSVALGTDTTGDYVTNLGTLTGLTTSGNSGEGSTPTLSVTYGSGTNTAVQGSTTLTCPSGTGNLAGTGNAITLGSGGTCNSLNTVQNPTFTTSVTTPLLTLTGAGSNGSLQVANLGQTTTYTLPDPGQASATFCLSTGNCTATGTAGGDLTGSYPNPTIAKLQGTDLNIASPVAGHVLVYNNTNARWENRAVSGDIAISETGVATIQNNAVTSAKIADGTIANGDLASGSFTNITGVGTLTGLTVAGTTNINTSGTANTSIGNSAGSIQITSSGLNVSTGGALTGVAGITTSGGYLQSGTTANTFTGASSFTAAGTALSVTNNATIGGALTVNTITPNSALTIGATSQTFTLQGNATSTLTATDGDFTTTLGFVTPTADATINLPALGAGTYTLCTSSGNCGGVGATLQTAYDFSTNPEIVLDATRGALTIRDASSSVTTLLEVQNNAGSTTYFNVTTSGVGVTGAVASSGDINTTGGDIQTAGVDRLTNGGNLVNIGTITTSGAINSQTISAAANFTGTLTVQGANALTLGTASTNTGAILFKGSGGTGTLTVRGPATPDAGNFVLSIPAITGNANICTDNSVCSGYAPASGSGNYANTTLSNLGGVVAINSTLQPAAAGGVDLGAGALPFRDLYLAGSSSSPGANNFRITGTATGGTRTITLPDATGTVCLQSSSACGFASGSGQAFVQGGNIFSAPAVLGTNDSNSLSFETGGLTQATIAVGGATTFQNSTDSASALRVLNAAGTAVLTVNTSSPQVEVNAPLAASQGFEGVTFPPASPGAWTTGGNANWSRSTTVFQEGAASAASGTITHSQSSYLDLNYTFTSSGQLLFYWRVDSEQFLDELFLCVDNDSCTSATSYAVISGNQTWAEVVVPVAAGARSFRWVYAKDSSGSTGTDKGWVDNIRIHEGGILVASSAGTSDSKHFNLIQGGSTKATVTDSSLLLATNIDLLLQGSSANISNTQGFDRSEVFGLNASVTDNDAVAFGADASAGLGGTAIGYFSNASGADSVALGDAASATQTYAVALGSFTDANFRGSIALGVSAETTAENQLVIGSNNEEISSVRIGNGVTNATPIGFTLQGTSGTGTNIAGASVTIAGGQSTGSAAGGSINLQVSASGSSGTATNSLSTVLSLSGSNGAATFQNISNSTTAFRVLNATSVPQFVIDTASSSPRVYIGNPTADGTAGLLVLDTKNSSGDPAAGVSVNGAMYYNSNANKFRCYQNSAWVDCVYTREYLRAEMRTIQDTASEVDQDDHIKFANVQASAGSSISLDTASAYVEGGTGASVGRFTLTAGKTYKLHANINQRVVMGSSSSIIVYGWYDVTSGALLGSAGSILPSDWAGDSREQGAPAEAVFTPGVSTRVEVRIMDLNGGSITSIGFTSSTFALYPNAFIEVL